MHEINTKIARNLAYYRKAAGFTQAELAEKINYSDKSVSKWESGNGIPDVYIMLELTKLYGITLNDLVADDEPKPITNKKSEKKKAGKRLFVMLLSSGIVWLVATVLFVMLRIILPSGPWWVVFLYAVMANAIVMIVFTGLWRYRLMGFVSVSTLIWITLTCIYVTANLIKVHVSGEASGIWYVFLLGIPLQVLEVLWVFFRSLFKKNRVREEKDIQVNTEIVEDKQ